MGFNVLDERLVMYLCLLSSLCTSFFVCCRAFLFLCFGVLLKGKVFFFELLLKLMLELSILELISIKLL